MLQIITVTTIIFDMYCIHIKQVVDHNTYITLAKLGMITGGSCSMKMATATVHLLHAALHVAVFQILGMTT